MATIYYTIHIPDADIPRDSPSVVLGGRFYFFNWITSKHASSTTSEMEVVCLDTRTLRWQRSILPKGEGPDAVAPTPRTGHALAAAGGRIFMWGGQHEGVSADVLWWSPNEDSNVAGAWRRLPLINQRSPVLRRGHCLFPVDGRYLVLAGGIDTGGRNSQDLWVLDLRAQQWKYVRAWPGFGPYLWEGASYCAVDKLPVPRLYVFGCELYRHHWNGASCLHLHGLSSEKYGALPENYEPPPPNDHVQAHWQRLVLHSSCSLQWRSPCLAMDGCVYAFDVSPVTISGSSVVPTASAVLALWRLSVVTHRWQRIPLLSSSPAPLSFDAVAFVDRKVIILGRVCRNNADKTERDLHIIDFAPTLQTLCICSIAKNGIDPSPLPPTLREKVQRHCPRMLT